MSRLSDLGLLVPAFRERLEQALADVRAAGHSPIVHETLRSKERALQLVADGKSKARGGLSMHCFACACDVICGLHGWDCHKHGCRFFSAYGIASERHGLTWGGRWKDPVDSPHCQAVPLRLQDAVRAMPAEHLDTYVRSVLAGLVKRGKVR